MTEPLVTTTALKQRVVWAATQLLRRAGCDVIQTTDGNRVRLDVTLPAESTDPHGARLALAAGQLDSRVDIDTTGAAVDIGEAVAESRHADQREN